MRTYFVYSNLKVSPFINGDAPIPGFELLTWDHESSVPGTLWDLGHDAGLTKIGKGVVYGQLWVAENTEKIRLLEEYMGVYSGLTEPNQVDVKVTTPDGEIQEIIKAVTFHLTNIKNSYKIVEDGKWQIKRLRDINLL